MADESQKRDENLFKGLSLPGKEFILPSISSPWLMEEFVIHPEVSDQIEQESYPTAILDDSCVAEVLSEPSIPLVESVEAFAMGHIETPVGSCVRANANHLIQKSKRHDFQISTAGNAESAVTYHVKEKGNHVPLRDFSGSTVPLEVRCDVNGHSGGLHISSNNPQAGLVRVPEGTLSPDVNSFLPSSSVNLDGKYGCSLCGACFPTLHVFQGHQTGCARAVRGKEPENVGYVNNLMTENPLKIQNN